jgi:ribosomal protein S25
MQAELESPEAYARQTIAHALRRAPYDVWTREALASRFGISLALTTKVLAELVRVGVAQRLDGPDEEYAAVGADY